MNNNMEGSIWVSEKLTDGKIFYSFQVSGIKRGSYTKILDPTFKTWKEVGSGYNLKNSTETAIYSKFFISDEEMVSWVKENIKFHTVYDKCTTKCKLKVLVSKVNEEKDVKPRKTKSPIS